MMDAEWSASRSGTTSGQADFLCLYQWKARGMNIPIRQYWNLLVSYLKPQWPLALLLGVLILGNIGLQLVNPQIMRGFIDSTQAGDETDVLWRSARVLSTS